MRWEGGVVEKFSLVIIAVWIVDKNECEEISRAKNKVVIFEIK